ncbi:Type 1 phosphatases regulator ypi1 [Penicillium capsulatum]|uniref:Type 1 phosphatases regulator ypi1 n=1 Tax=Penicillium capsulatum TaxID=69766 RepID=A0A9W9HN76_9EURO|nr:Type 1 phosphatases regulator ypi1 [Penicillium capsulatum]
MKFHDEVCPNFRLPSFTIRQSLLDPVLCHASVPPVVGQPPPQTATETSRDSPTVRLPRTLRLRGDETPGTNEPSPARHIRWSEDVVDNEGMGKKSSKGDLFSCAVSTTKPVQWAKVARNPSLTPVHPTPRVTMNPSAEEPEPTTVTTLIPEGNHKEGNPRNIQATEPRLLAVRTPDTQSLKGGSQVQMHMRRCPSRPKILREAHE